MEGWKIDAIGTTTKGVCTVRSKLAPSMQCMNYVHVQSRSGVKNNSCYNNGVGVCTDVHTV